MLEYPAVSISVETGELARILGIERIDINYLELYRRLRDMGEYEYENSPPLKIMFHSYHDPQLPYPRAFARALSEVEVPDEVIMREVHIPIFEAHRRAGGSLVRYDAAELHDVVNHELRHAVDHNNIELLSEQQSAQEKIQQKEKRARLLRKFGAAALALTGGWLVSRGIIERDGVSGVQGVGCELASVMLYQLATLVPRNQFRSTPMEKRASEAEEVFRPSPSIVEVRKIGTLT